MSRYAPTVAVIIPAYNAAATLDRTLKSAVASLRHCVDAAGLTVEADIIVVDDRSTDDTPNIVKRWAQQYPTVKLHINAENRGPGFARNEGVRQTSAQYLFFLDADDVFYDNHIHTCLAALLADDALGYVFTRMKIDMPMHPEWRDSLDESCPINFCVRRVWHEWIKGFAEEEDFRTYRTEDTLYRMCLRKLVKHKKIDVETCEQFISPGNALDRQRQKLAMSKADWAKSGISDGFVMTDQMKEVSLDRLMHVERIAGRV
ncbi:MAG: glycosyltransferase family 2 protein [Rhodospirillaceae bacterium]|nr:glycosyltransferase family 2 protein [Rhodospirillaceae bacterium]